MYDIVVVGGGSAGCVLATRLTEDEGRRVLLLEAGGPDVDDRIKIPAAFSQLFRTRYDWSYATTPQQHVAAGVAARPGPRGLVLDQRHALRPRQRPRLRRVA
jgi:choline dehydrogenase